MTPSSSVTQLLERARQGDSAAGQEVWRTLYDDLRSLAARRLAGTPKGPLQPTALVHEVFLRLVDPAAHCQNRTQFMAVASEVMRHVLLDEIRAAHRQKRGGGRTPVELEALELVADRSTVDLLALDEALQELEKLSPRRCKVVVYRFFGGLALEEIAESLAVTRRVVDSEWKHARAWLYRRLQQSFGADVQSTNGAE